MKRYQASTVQGDSARSSKGHESQRVSSASSASSLDFFFRTPVDNVGVKIGSGSRKCAEEGLAFDR